MRQSLYLSLPRTSIALEIVLRAFKYVAATAMIDISDKMTNRRQIRKPGEHFRSKSAAPKEPRPSYYTNV